jgi:hypothetical protein
MSDLFAIDDPTADRAYSNIREPRGEGAAVARANCDELWRDFAPYASEQFRVEFRRHFHQRWFEMYLAVALLRAGLSIECPPNAAPDVRVQHRDGRVLWLEATAPTGGDESNPDRVVQPIAAPGETSVAYPVPTQQVTLRICGALREKAAKLMIYRDRGIIAPEHQAVIAVNVHGIPHAVYDAERLGLAATYGVGYQYVTFDRATLDVVHSGFHHTPELLRSSGSTVDAAPFLHPGFAHVAGALISGTDAANCPHPPGYDFMLFPNPNAAPAYSERQLPIDREWRLAPLVEGGYPIIEVIEHSERTRMVRLFHATSQENARNILSTGFVDSSRELHAGRWYAGAWLAEVALHELEPAILLVSMPEDLVTQYELPSEQGYRRWLVPADLINRHATIVEYRRQAKPHPL